MPEIRSPGSAPQHGIKGVFYGGSWLDIKSGDIEDFVSPADPSEERGRCSGDCSVCPRSKSRNNAAKDDGSYDVVIVGAGKREGLRFKIFTEFNHFWLHHRTTQTLDQYFPWWRGFYCLNPVFSRFLFHLWRTNSAC